MTGWPPPRPDHEVRAVLRLRRPWARGSGDVVTLWYPRVTVTRLLEWVSRAPEERPGPVGAQPVVPEPWTAGVWFGRGDVVATGCPDCGEGHTERCPLCRGTGEVECPRTEPCPECRHSLDRCYYCDGARERICHRCGGSGRAPCACGDGTRPCSRCAGTGVVSAFDGLRVQRGITTARSPAPAGLVLRDTDYAPLPDLDAVPAEHAGPLREWVAGQGAADGEIDRRVGVEVALVSVLGRRRVVVGDRLVRAGRRWTGA
ncbi:hypothetical protein [Actinosynnema sp. NPDC020468]|uniref:hypothetical protein n=1 Tax=Actinosynnema sp. NPDC020468 TaxID=3154488 RepID=UPI0033EF7898